MESLRAPVLLSVKNQNAFKGLTLSIRIPEDLAKNLSVLACGFMSRVLLFPVSTALLLFIHKRSFKGFALGIHAIERLSHCLPIFVDSFLIKVGLLAIP